MRPLPAAGASLLLLAGCGRDLDGDGVDIPADTCPGDAAKSSPGICGCGIPDRDPDGDGLPSCVDACPDAADADQADLDADGLGDACEACPTVPNPDGDPAACACAVTAAPCVDGLAAGFPCEAVDLLGHLPLATWPGASVMTDVWGWVAPDGREIVLAALDTGLAVVDVTVPSCPAPLGFLPAATEGNLWRDVEVLGRHAVVGSEAADHGLQILDLERALGGGLLAADAWYRGTRAEPLGSSHTVTIDPVGGTVAANGSTSCGGGQHFVDLSDPLRPVFAGCFSAAGYVHDAQCVTYRGPDLAHAGARLCVTANGEDLTVSVVDATDPAAPRELSRFAYGDPARALGGAGAGFSHQGWFDEDQRYFYLGDEFDELAFAVDLTTYVLDLADLEHPALAAVVVQEGVGAIDHQQFVRDGFLYQSDYAAGLRILDLADPLAPEVVATFDVYPDFDIRFFVGSWAHYPFLPSGVVAVGSMEEGLLLVRPRLR